MMTACRARACPPTCRRSLPLEARSEKIVDVHGDRHRHQRHVGVAPQLPAFIHAPAECLTARHATRVRIARTQRCCVCAERRPYGAWQPEFLEHEVVTQLPCPVRTPAPAGPGAVDRTCMCMAGTYLDHA